MPNPDAKERVLSTLNKDGTRRFIRPKLSPGQFHKWRRAFAYFLIAIFTVTPYLRLNGKPLILLDIPHREFTLFGKTFLPTDTMLLMLALVAGVLAIFFLTALFGRVWCGWACPQTVYMEFLYRPIERFFEGSPANQRKIDREGITARRIAKYAVFSLCSIFLAHTFLGYFVGVETLFQWIQKSPLEHPFAFFVMAGVTLAMMLDFAWFREQVCIVACPYGRIQSVLLDRQSVIVGYDAARGEPRTQPKKHNADMPHGDCIDCSACVNTCPTGIDIRDGLQMECIGCTQCIDACDAIMARIGKPTGLVRYGSRDQLEGKPQRTIRPRIIAYPLLLLVVLSLLGVALARQQTADVTVLRAIDSPFRSLPGETILNRLRVKIVNRSAKGERYFVKLQPPTDASLILPGGSFVVSPGKMHTAPLFISAPAASFRDGKMSITLDITSEAGFKQSVSYPLLGPQKAAKQQ